MNALVFALGHASSKLGSTSRLWRQPLPLGVPHSLARENIYARCPQDQLCRWEKTLSVRSKVTKSAGT